MEIRKAIADDAQSIASLLHQLGYTQTSRAVEHAIETPADNSEVYVAVIDGAVVGFMSIIYFYYFPSQCNVCRITGITVDASIRGTGIGSKLIALAKDMARENSCKQLEVTTSLVREKTQQYYAYLGFKKASFRYYQVIED